MLNRSFHLVTIADIPIKIHWSFGLLFVWIIYTGYSSGMEPVSITWFCLFTLVIFCCVIMHEYGHALTGRHFGVSTQDILITPIGGIARLVRIPEKPVQELLIAIAGPLVNVVIAILLGTALWIWGPQGIDVKGTEATIFQYPSNFLPLLFWLNIMLIVFNMLPAFPMDGGRVLRSLLSMKLGRIKATKIASVTGQVLAAGLFGYGVYAGALVLAFIGVFIFMAAAGEYRMVKQQNLMVQMTVSDLIRSNYTPLHPTDPMGKAVELLRRGEENNFLVMDDDANRVIGILEGRYLHQFHPSGNLSDPVGMHIQTHFEQVSPSLNLKHLFTIFHNEGYSILPVFNYGNIVGVVERADLAELMKKKPRRFF